MPSATLPSITVSAPTANQGVVTNDDHIHRRMFIGPMPEKVLSQTEAQAMKSKKRKLFRSSTVQEEDDMTQIIRENAFTFFLREGGRPEDWGENEEQGVREEMIRRWRESEWGAIWRNRRRKKESCQASNWVGGSFEIGQILGVNVLQEAESARTRERTTSHSTRKISLTDSQRPAAPSSTGRGTFFSAHSGLNNLQPSTSRLSLAINGQGSINESSPSSSTVLLRPSGPPRERARTESVPRPIIKAPSLSAISDNNLNNQGKGKARFVRYADMPEEPSPAPPSEVLERSGSAVEDTSAGAAAAPEPPSPIPSLEWGDVVMRDRMLVRSCYTKSESISPHFDEVVNRTTRYLQYAEWAEYMVAWRKDRIEIYRDHNVPGKEWLKGHKHLAFVIPLKSSRTQMSLYSFVDLTFCITCAPTRTDSSTSFRLFSREKEGTNIFVFKLKSRSRAYDWAWLLWRDMGGQLPSTIEVRNPRMDTKVKIDIPTTDKGQRHDVFSRSNVIGLCIESLSSVGDWKNVIEREMMLGKSLELAWRVDTNLDWIWLDTDVDGHPRPSAVLCGLALKQSTRPAVLEIRLSEHYPSHIHLKNGSRLHEPPSIEGYLDRIRPNTQTKQSIYLATHDGNLFTLSPNRAHPPSPPGFTPGLGDIDSYAESLRLSEAQRGTKQLMDATGVADLRTILLIRRAFHLVPISTHNESKKGENDDLWFGIWSQPEERTLSDDQDEGGEEGVAKAEDRLRLRMRRSFELLLTTGRVIRFEAYSCRVAVEWIERLRALVLYWKQRHRIDAREEMDLAQARRPRLTPQTRVFQDGCELPPEPPADTSTPLPALGSLYSWCVLDGCKPIIRGGKVYMRRGLHGQYKLVQMFLIAGHLVQFRITPKSSLYSSMRKKTNLMDAYVCSGYFAALALPKGQYKANSGAAPRRYQDGLETDDPEEDMLFMVWYRPQAPMVENVSTQPAADSPPAAPKGVPALSAKRKLLVFRTRSKLERDAWCWAINSEIERIVRTQKVREEKLRETGSLVKL